MPCAATAVSSNQENGRIERLLIPSSIRLPIKACNKNRIRITRARMLFHFLMMLPSLAAETSQNVLHVPMTTS